MLPEQILEPSAIISFKVRRSRAQDFQPVADFAGQVGGGGDCVLAVGFFDMATPRTCESVPDYTSEAWFRPALPGLVTAVRLALGGAMALLPAWRRRIAVLGQLSVWQPALPAPRNCSPGRTGSFACVARSENFYGAGEGPASRHSRRSPVPGVGCAAGRIPAPMPPPGAAARSTGLSIRPSAGRSRSHAPGRGRVSGCHRGSPHGAVTLVGYLIGRFLL